MKRLILTIALCLIGAVAYCEPQLLSHSDGNYLYYLSTTGTYALYLKNLEGGDDIVITLYNTENETTGAFDLMLGIISDIYPEFIGIYQGKGYALMFKSGGGIGFECEGKLGCLDMNAILKFRGAVEARK